MGSMCSSPTAVKAQDGYSAILPNSAGSLDTTIDGIDFNIDTSYLPDADNEKEWQAYIIRRRKFQKQLDALYDKTPKLEIQKLPDNINYVRPFLSSTFKDFNEERNICFAQSFPRLEKLCNDRGVFFAPLDLRWGVTSEQSGSGQVIKICLEEIDRSRPYFVVSLGFRNGWAFTPYDKPNDGGVQLLKKTFEIGCEYFPWVKDRYDRSVTELEILHGALNDPAKASRTFFYFRDVEFLTDLDKSKRKLFVEMGDAEKKLQELKTRIVKAGFKVRYFKTPQDMSDILEEDLRESIERDFPAEKYSALERELKDHQAFAEMRTRVYVGGETMIRTLDDFIMSDVTQTSPLVVTGPSGAGKSSLMANWMANLKKRHRENAFPGKKRDLELEKKMKLERDAARKTAKKPEYGTGDIGGGSGDDMMMNENIDNTPRASIPTKNTNHEWNWNVGLFIDRYIGSTSDSSAPATLLRWIMQEIKEKYDLEQQVPSDTKKVIEEFPDWLELASVHGPVLIVLDGLDQLAEDDDAHHLIWLPKTWPKGVRVVLSTIAGSVTHQNLQARQTQALEVQPLSDPQCLSLIQTFLNSYGKKLDGAQESKIMECDRTRNPLYLVTFLQELRVFGVYENLNKRIDHYMEAKSISEMFLKCIGRLEEDFDVNVPDLVRHTLSLLMLSRRGLNEVELKGALELALHVSAKEKSFPNMEFSALMLRLDQQLVDQRGLRKFSHNYLRQAVMAKYFQTHDVIESHAILAEYFSKQVVSERKVEEMPWHLYTICQALNNGEAQKSDQKFDLDSVQKQLMDCLTALDMFDLMKGEYKYDLHKYWLQLEHDKDKKDLAARSYKGALALYNQLTKPKPLEFAEKAEDIGTFLIETDRYYGADLYLDQALEMREKMQGSDHPDIEILLSKKANLFYRMGRFEDALPLYQKALAIVEKHEGNKSVRQSVLRTSIAGLLKEQGKFDESLPLYEKSLQDKINLLGPRHPVVAISMSNLADLFLRMFKPEKALPLYKDALEIMENSKGRSHPQVAVVLSSLASCYMQLKNHREAVELYERAKKIKENLLGKNHISVAVVLNNLAACYQSQGDFEKALKLYERSLKIRQATHGVDNALVAPTINNMAMIYLEEKKYSVAMSYFQQALEIVEKGLGKYHVDLINTLNSMVEVHMQKKEYPQALNIYLRELDIVERAYGADSIKIVQYLNNVGMVYQSMSDYDKALPYHLRELKLYEAGCGKRSKEVADTLMILGVVYVSLTAADDQDDAKRAFRRAWMIRDKLFGREHDTTKEAESWLMDVMENEDEMDYDKMKAEAEEDEKRSENKRSTMITLKSSTSTATGGGIKITPSHHSSNSTTTLPPINMPRLKITQSTTGATTLPSNSISITGHHSTQSQPIINVTPSTTTSSPAKVIQLTTRKSSAS